MEINYATKSTCQLEEVYDLNNHPVVQEHYAVIKNELQWQLAAPRQSICHFCLPTPLHKRIWKISLLRR